MVIFDMPVFLKYFLWSLLVMFFLTYLLGWVDLVNNDQLTGDTLKDFLNSFPYYFEWVLPYWWLIIGVGSIILALIGFGARFGIRMLKK